MQPGYKPKNTTQIIHLTASVVISRSGHTTGQWLKISSYESTLYVILQHFKAYCDVAAIHCCQRENNRRIGWSTVLDVQQSESLSEFLSANSHSLLHSSPVISPVHFSLLFWGTVIELY